MNFKFSKTDVLEMIFVAVLCVAIAVVVNFAVETEEEKNDGPPYKVITIYK